SLGYQQRRQPHCSLSKVGNHVITEADGKQT
nr:hypothetical protein [Tanacetum cinerariifolium]